MYESPTNQQITADNPSGSAGRIAFLLFAVCVVWALVFWAPVAPATGAPTPKTVHRYSLLNGVVAAVDTEGSLLISAGGSTTPLLTADVVPLTAGRRNHPGKSTPFNAVVAEGAAAGQRGFSTRCDDDGDGAVDEDPLDGKDNDGDGQIDEDFAAISDAMVVVNQDGPGGNGRASHIEYYHWAYTYLRSTVFLSARGRPGPSNGGLYRLVLGDHKWHQATLVGPYHSVAGKAEFSRVEGYVAQPARSVSAVATSACDDAAGRWVGVVVLSTSVGPPAALEGGVLELPLGEEPLSLAVCVADSWLQLNMMLNEATRVYAGATDKITGQRAPWIVPPLCARCRLSAAPDFSFNRTAAGELVITAEIIPERGVAIDPDLFQLEGRALGAPRRIQWESRGGPVSNIAWTCMSSTLLDSPHDLLSDPYGQWPHLLSHQASGELRFIFAADGQIQGSGPERLQGHYLDGRPFEARLHKAPDSPAAIVETQDSHPAAKLEDRRIVLSPQLLEGFPNPFRDYIQLKFTVPSTVREAFVWGDGQEPPRDINLEAAVPWQGGTPSVSVKIYSLNGQELVTLFSASQGPGVDVVQWDGTDSLGRQVASGTYFCKLQMDKYSVTRRLVYLR